MRPVKRLEIVVNRYDLPQVLDLLTRGGAPGYTVLHHATGKGGRGEQAADELTGVFENACVLCACPPEIVPGLLDRLGPLLRRTGGFCLVSDAESLLP